MKTCKDCEGTCCKYVTAMIDGPFTFESVDYIKWLLIHENVVVFLDAEYNWVVKFITPCKRISKDNLCKDYNNRFKICRDYTFDKCEKYSDGAVTHALFNNPEDVDKYVKDNKIILTHDED